MTSISTLSHIVTRGDAYELSICAPKGISSGQIKEALSLWDNSTRGRQLCKCFSVDATDRTRGLAGGDIQTG